MSAVASSHHLPASVAGHAHAAATVSHVPLELEAAEQKRWMTWFGFPVLVAAVFVGLVFGTGQEAYLGFAVAAIVADIGVLIWLTLSSDTNGVIGEVAASDH